MAQSPELSARDPSSEATEVDLQCLKVSFDVVLCVWVSSGWRFLSICEERGLLVDILPAR